MNEFLYTIVSVVFVSLISLIGVFTISFRKEFLNRIIIIFVAFAAGSLLGAAFFDILPEAVEKGGSETFAYALGGIIVFFAMERYIYWHHCHSKECEKHYHPAVYLNLVGDALHNFVDGALIAASFLANVQLGIVTTFAIIAHEIPQEIGDFAILVHGGFTPQKAIVFNFISALTAIVGAIATFFFVGEVKKLVSVILAIAAGGFIYIATADLIPEIHKETKKENVITQSVALLLGIVVIFVLTSILSF